MTIYIIEQLYKVANKPNEIRERKREMQGNYSEEEEIGVECESSVDSHIERQKEYGLLLPTS